MSFAESELDLCLPITGSNASKKTHLLKVWKQTGKKPKDLADQTEIPYELAYVWEWFLELIGSGEVSWVGLAAWSGVSGIKLQSRETQLLLSLNRLYASVQDGRRNQASSQSR